MQVRFQSPLLKLVTDIEVNTDSKIYFKGMTYTEDQVLRLTGIFSDFNINKERIIFEGAANREEMLKSYKKVDIALDTFPYPGGTTSCEALWMGRSYNYTTKGDDFCRMLVKVFFTQLIVKNYSV